MALVGVNVCYPGSYDKMDSRCACGQCACVNDVHLVCLIGKFVIAGGGATRYASNFERGYSNVTGYALRRGLAET